MSAQSLRLDHLTMSPFPSSPRFAARLHAATLDARLARGADPASSTAMQARAEHLTGPAQRAVMAKALNDAIRRAATPPAVGMSRRLRMSPEAAGDAHDALADLAHRLVAPVVIRPQGAALAGRLLRDGSSPLYRRAAAGELRAAAERALSACDEPV